MVIEDSIPRELEQGEYLYWQVSGVKIIDVPEAIHLSDEAYSSFYAEGAEATQQTWKLMDKLTVALQGQTDIQQTVDAFVKSNNLYFTNEDTLQLHVTEGLASDKPIKIEVPKYNGNTFVYEMTPVGDIHGLFAIKEYVKDREDLPVKTYADLANGYALMSVAGLKGNPIQRSLIHEDEYAGSVNIVKKEMLVKMEMPSSTKGISLKPKAKEMSKGNSIADE